MKYINIPAFIVPENLDELVSKQQVQPLSFCLNCPGYVLCSCGRCHNTLGCNEPCGYDQDASQQKEGAA